MVDEQTHYDALGVSEDASSKEIKQAFYRKVREHPPEKDPEGHKRIREAYNVLSNPVSRSEYDNMASYGDEIEELREEAEALLQQDPPSLEEAIRKLKKAVVLGPNIGLLRNLLGNCYLADDSPDAALEQFNRAIELDSSNSSYRLNKAQALQKMGRLERASGELRDVWSENKGDYAAARALANVLFDRDQIDEAHEVLDEAIWADDQLDFEDFFCYFDKLQLYVFQGKTDILEDELEKVIDLAERPEDKEFAAFMLGKTGYQLYEADIYGLSDRFINAALELNPEDPYLQSLSGLTGELRGLEESLHSIMESGDIHDFVKHIMAVYYGVAIGELSGDEAESRLSGISEALDNVMRVDPDHTEIKQSLRRIRDQHPEAFALNEDLFKLILYYPDPNLFAGDCPHCGETITTENNYGTRGNCPSCYRGVRFTGSKFEKTSSSSMSSGRSSSSTSTSKTSSTSASRSTSTNNSDSSSGGSNIGWIIGIIVFLFFMAQAC